MKMITYHGGEEFDVTEADMVSVAPLGFNLPDPEPSVLIDEIKAAMNAGILTDGMPHGFWDAYLDEGEWACADSDCEDEFCCAAKHQVCTRPITPDRDDVFVRIPMAMGAAGDIDLQVYARNRDDVGKVIPRAHVTINGESYSPEDCVKDLGAMLAVFRFFVARGDL